jgi:DNA invertase Pin-like site-specific DNA recombinase
MEDTARSTDRQSTPTLGYASVAPGEPLDGPAIEDQLVAIRSACERLNLHLIDVGRDHQPDGGEGRTPAGLIQLLDRIDSGEASCLIVSDIERLARRTAQLETILDRLEKQHARLVALDLGLDSATEVGGLAIGRRAGASAGEMPAAEVPAPEPLLARQAEPEPTTMRAFGYATAPADSEQSIRELDRQRRAIERYCRGHGIEVVEVVRERESKDGKALDRAGLSFLLERITAGDASCLVVTGLQRLARSVAELGTIVQWLERNQVRLIAVELDLDTASPGGRTTARALASVTGMAGSDWVAIRKRIADMRADGMTLQSIADTLNNEGVPTPRGETKWRPSSVQTATRHKRPLRTPSDPAGARRRL